MLINALQNQIVDRISYLDASGLLLNNSDFIIINNNDITTCGCVEYCMFNNIINKKIYYSPGLTVHLYRYGKVNSFAYALPKSRITSIYDNDFYIEKVIDNDIKSDENNSCVISCIKINKENLIDRYIPGLVDKFLKIQEMIKNKYKDGYNLYENSVEY